MRAGSSQACALHAMPNDAAVIQYTDDVPFLIMLFESIGVNQVELSWSQRVQVAESPKRLMLWWGGKITTLCRKYRIRVFVIRANDFLRGQPIRVLSEHEHEIAVLDRGETAADLPEGVGHIRGGEPNEDYISGQT